MSAITITTMIFIATTNANTIITTTSTIMNTMEDSGVASGELHCESKSRDRE